MGRRSILTPPWQQSRVHSHVNPPRTTSSELHTRTTPNALPHARPSRPHSPTRVQGCPPAPASCQTHSQLVCTLCMRLPVQATPQHAFHLHLTRRLLCAPTHYSLLSPLLRGVAAATLALLRTRGVAPPVSDSTWGAAAAAALLLLPRRLRVLVEGAVALGVRVVG